MQPYKLVRDKIPDLIRASGKNPIIHIATSDEEFKRALCAKLTEEFAEFQRNPSAEEMVDVLEVLISFANLKDISGEEIEEALREKAGARGTFDERIILEKIEDR